MCTVSTEPLPDPKKVISGTDIPEWVSAAGRQLYDQSAEIAAQDFPTFTGPRLATYGDALDDQGNRIQVGMTEPTAPTFADAQDFFQNTVVPSDAFQSSDKPLFASPRITPAVEGYQPPPMTLSDITPEARQLMIDQGFSFLAPEAQPIYAQNRLTAQEREGSRLLSQGADTYQSYLDDATKMAGTLGTGYDSGTFTGADPNNIIGESFNSPNQFSYDNFNPEMARQYQDVFQTSVDPALEQLNRQRDLRQRQNSADAVRAGAFGGSRLGLREATTDAEIARAGSDIRREAGREGLQFAQQRYDTDRAFDANRYDTDRAFDASRFDAERSARFGAEDQRRAGFETGEAARLRGFETGEASRLRATEALQGFAPLVQGLTEQAASGLITAGQAQRQLDQRGLDMAYGDYLEQRNYPQEQLNFALGALQGVPYETRTIGLEQGQQFVQSPSIYGQTIGGLGSLASAYYLRNR